MPPFTTLMQCPWRFLSQRAGSDRSHSPSCPAHQPDAYELGDIQSTACPSSANTSARSPICLIDTSATVTQRSTSRDSERELRQSQPKPHPYVTISPSTLFIDLRGCS